MLEVNKFNSIHASGQFEIWGEQCSSEELKEELSKFVLNV